MNAPAPMLPLVQPWLGPECADAVRDQINTGFLGPGKATAAFGAKLAAIAGVAHGVPTVSGTVALTVAAKALDLQPGDEILVPAYGVISTINAFTSAGLVPRLVEIDFATGCRFSIYATWWVRQSISRGIAKQGRIVRLPVHVAEQVNQVSAVRRTLERRHGREPELVEIADELGLTEQQVVDLIRLSRDHVSLDAPVEENGDTALGDLLARELSPGPDEVVLDAEDRARLDAMLGSLDERSADVVRRRYGLMDGRQAKLADIAAIWGITAERVRQIERHAITKLRVESEVAA